MIFGMLDDEKLFYEENFKRTHTKNKNALIVIVGGTGEGKSYAGMRQAEIVTDKKVTIKDITFLPSEFLKRIESTNRSAIMLDDAGISLNARDFMSKSNKLLSLALESCRFKNQTLIITVPTLKMIDINARRLMHTCFWMKFVNEEKKYSCATWYNVEINPIIDKIYYKHPKITEAGEIKEKSTMRIRKPEDAFVEEYEREKKDFLDPLYIDFIEELEKIEDRWKGIKKRRQERKESSDPIYEAIT